MKWIRSILVMLVASLSLVFVLPAQVAHATSWLSVPVTSADAYVTAPNGEITVGCDYGRDLVTYSSSGTSVRTIDSTQTIDGVPNCIDKPVVDQDGALYGRPYSFSTSTYGTNLLAYDGTTLRWKSPVSCSSARKNLVVGSDGIVYVTTNTPSGARLLGLDPVLAPSQTQPTVVFDESIGSCNVELQAFDGGIAVSYPSNPSTTFFDESGSTLGSVGKVGSVNADGQLYTVTGSSGVSVALYDTDGSQEWSYASSDFNVIVPRVYPSPDGGVFIPGVGTSGSQTYLKKLDHSGNVVRTMVLWDNSAAGSDFWAPTLAPVPAVVNNKGQFIYYQGGYGSSGSVTNITVVSSSMRIISQHETSDFVPASMLADIDVLKISGNKVFLESGGGMMGSASAIDADHPDAGFDYPRSSIFEYDNPKLQYVAMGDSYSSGEGNPAFTSFTDQSGVNVCHRSEDDAYPTLLADDSSLNLELVDFVACSGAKVDNVKSGGATDGAWNEAPQLASLSEETDIVTITIGGNDVNFGGFLTACLTPNSGCDNSTTVYSDTEDDINELPTKLEDLFDEIASRIGENAAVYVIGYPVIISDDSVGPLSNCYLLNSGDREAAEELANLLDFKALTAVSDFDDSRFEYVSAMGENSPFDGHDMCSEENYIREYNLSDPQVYTAHPNSLGQAAYKELITDAIS